MPDWTIGAVLVAGFLGMLLLDQLQHKVGGHHGHGHMHGHPLGRAPPHLRNSDDDLEEAVPVNVSPVRGAAKVGTAPFGSAGTVYIYRMCDVLLRVASSESPCSKTENFGPAIIFRYS